MSTAINQTRATPEGAMLTKAYAAQANVWNFSGSLTTTTPVTARAAQAGLRNYVTAFQAINTGAAASDLIVLDGATERFRLTLPINVPVSIVFPVELLTTVNTALNVNLSAATTVAFNAQGYTAA